MSQHMWHIAFYAVRFFVRLRRIVRTAPRLSHAEIEHLKKIYWEVAVANAELQAEGQGAANENLTTLEGITNFLQRFKEPHPPTTVSYLLSYVGYDVQTSGSTRQPSMLLSQLIMMFTYLKREQVLRSAVSDEETLFLTFCTDKATTEDGNKSSSADDPSEGMRVRSSPIEQVLQSFDLKVLPPQAFHKDNFSDHHHHTEEKQNPRLTMREFFRFLRQGQGGGGAVQGANVMAPEDAELAATDSGANSPTPKFLVGANTPQRVSPVEPNPTQRGGLSNVLFGRSTPPAEHGATPVSQSVAGAGERHLIAAYPSIAAIAKLRRHNNASDTVNVMPTDKTIDFLSCSGIHEVTDLHTNSDDDEPSEDILMMRQRLQKLPEPTQAARYEALHQQTVKATAKKEWDKYDPSAAARQQLHPTQRPQSGGGLLTLVRRTANPVPLSKSTEHSEDHTAHSCDDRTHNNERRPHSALQSKSQHSPLSNAVPRPQSAQAHRYRNCAPSSSTANHSSHYSTIDQDEEYVQSHIYQSGRGDVEVELHRRVAAEQQSKSAAFLRRMSMTPSFTLRKDQRQAVVRQYERRAMQVTKKYEGHEAATEVSFVAQRVAAEAYRAFQPSHHSNHSAEMNHVCSKAEHTLLHIPSIQAALQHSNNSSSYLAVTHDVGSYEVALRSRPASASLQRRSRLSNHSVAQTPLPPPSPSFL